MGKFLRDNWLAALVIGLIVGAFVFLRTPADTLASTREFDALVSKGTPTLVEFFSNT